MAYGIEGRFYKFEYSLECLTQRTPSVKGDLLDQKKEQKNTSIEMEDKQTALWQQVCPLLDGFTQLVKLPYDSVGEHDAKADAALLLGGAIYLVQFKTHHSQVSLHFDKKCKVLVDYEWKNIDNPPVFWCDSLPSKLQLLQLLIKFGFTSQRFIKAKEVYTKLQPLKGKEIIPRTLKKGLGDAIDDLIILGLIRQKMGGTWVVA